jgi:hypothetical protein
MVEGEDVELSVVSQRHLNSLLSAGRWSPV